jgi:hypothetical protein
MLVELLFEGNAKDFGEMMVVLLENVVIYIRLQLMIIVVQIVAAGDGMFC